MKKNGMIALKAGCGIGAACLAGLVITGYEIGWGPFRKLFKGFEDQVRSVEDRYDAKTRQGEIVFYGASNFRLWTEMERDLAPLPVQNHGFGGSTDELLMRCADRILYPYEPRIVVFQTGSNDLVSLSGTEAEKVRACMERKREMFEAFHQRLPQAQFVVMSGLLLPGRKEYGAMTQEINRELRDLCGEHGDFMTFVDASEMTFDGKTYREDLFRRDRIHLNRAGQHLWCDAYIRPALEELISHRYPDGL